MFAYLMYMVALSFIADHNSQSSVLDFDQIDITVLGKGR